MASWCWGELVCVRVFLVEFGTHCEIFCMKYSSYKWCTGFDGKAPPTMHARAQLTSDLCVHVLQSSTEYSVVQKIDCVSVQWN